MGHGPNTCSRHEVPASREPEGYMEVKMNVGNHIFNFNLEFIEAKLK